MRSLQIVKRFQGLCQNLKLVYPLACLKESKDALVEPKVSLFTAFKHCVLFAEDLEMPALLPSSLSEGAKSRRVSKDR